MLDDFTKNLLKRNLEISEESLKILKGMRRARRWATAFSLLKWIVIIGLTLGAYYYLEPYIRDFADTLNKLNSINSSQNLNQNNLAPDFLEKIKDLLPR